MLSGNDPARACFGTLPGIDDGVVAGDAVHIDLDDASVLSVDRTPGGLCIELEQRRDGQARRVRVVASGLVAEEAQHFVGAGVTAPHPDPALPLDFIEYAARGRDFLEFGGHLRDETWFHWRIVAGRFDFMELPADA